MLLCEPMNLCHALNSFHHSCLCCSHFKVRTVPGKMVEKYDKHNLRYVVTPVLGEIKWSVVLSLGKEIRQLKTCKKN